MNSPLKYTGAAVCFMEVPDQITLAFNISNCPHRCPGCHSQFLWEDTGELLMPNFVRELDKLSMPDNSKVITCACFMGGEWRPRELIIYSRICHKRGIKTCLYTGADHLRQIDDTLLNHLDYIKFGSWREYAGPLSDPNTNQRMFKLRDDQNRPALIDITHKFQKELL